MIHLIYYLYVYIHNIYKNIYVIMIFLNLLINYQKIKIDKFINNKIKNTKV